MSINSPIISIDCKKKEVLGNLYRDGKCYTQGVVKVYDHDYSDLAEGKVIPHGIYDLQRNKGYITIGTSHETAAFITDNLCWCGIIIAYITIQMHKTYLFFVMQGAGIATDIIFLRKNF